MPNESKETQDVTTIPAAAPAAVNPYVNLLAAAPLMQLMPLIAWVPLYAGINMNLFDPSYQVKQIVLQVLAEQGMVKDSDITKK